MATIAGKGLAGAWEDLRVKSGEVVHSCNAIPGDSEAGESLAQGQSEQHSKS